MKRSRSEEEPLSPTPSEEPHVMEPPPPLAKRARHGQRKRHISALVYNVSHIDVLISLSPQGKHTDTPLASKPATSGMIARPKFHSFNAVCRNLHNEMQQQLAGLVPPERLASFRSQNCGILRAGYRLNMLTERVWDEFYLKDVGSEHEGSNERPWVDAVFFPLVSVIIPKWLRLINANSDKVLYLVSGSGKPRDPDHDTEENSTEYAAKMIRLFLRACYPEIQVHSLYSGTGIFRFDHNVTFLNTELRPQIEAKRRELADGTGEWQTRFQLTLALSNGTPARVIAINSSLKSFRPNYMHIWQLKRFWHEYPNITCLVDDDVDIHPFENIAASPSISLNESPVLVQLLTAQMKQHRDAFLGAVYSGHAEELRTFWLRKTRKPVLCVLMVRGTPGGEANGQAGGLGGFKFYRGMNMEVSMPTGSLCAERNAISTALASNPTLSRSDLLMVGVLSVAMPSPLEPGNNEERVEPNGPFPDHDALNPLAPCGACLEWLRKVAEANPDFRVVTYKSTRCDRLFLNNVE